VSGRTLIFTPEAARELDALDAVIRERIERALNQLAPDTLALRNQIKRLKGDSALRLRVGEWRIIFDAAPGQFVILAIAHRREVYREEI
jgi:mRNA interferase RelE/StbE